MAVNLFPTVSFLLLICIYINSVSCKDQFGPQPKVWSSSKSADKEPHSDISTVSKFIKDFQKKLDDSSLSSNKYDMNLLKDYSSEYAQTGEEVLDDESETESDHKDSAAKNATSLVKCSLDINFTSTAVELVNSTRLMEVLSSDPNVTSRTQTAHCVILLFYARTCPFSCLAAPHFNAHARAFPNVKAVAINAMTHTIFNTQFGIGGVPSVMLFHNGRPAAKFNDTEYTLSTLSHFIQKYTGLEPAQRIYVLSSDFGGPVPSKMLHETDYWLIAAWAVVLGAVGYMVSRSQRWCSLIEAVQSAWRDANPHID